MHEKVKQQVEIPVALAMRYGNPSLLSGLQELHDKGVNEVMLFPLYPQHAMASTTTILELAEMHRNYHPIIATNVISEKYNSNSMIPVYASRISKNSYTGAKQKTISNGKGPDTSDRLFKLL